MISDAICWHPLFLKSETSGKLCYLEGGCPVILLNSVQLMSFRLCSANNSLIAA